MLGRRFVLRAAVSAGAWLLMVAITAFMAWCGPAQAQQVPAQAARYRAELTRAAHAAWGLGAPLATFAAQVHQESGWNAAAVSHVGAQGMAQFMPATADWWCQVNKLAPADCRPTNPVWALRAMVGYDTWLRDRLRAADGCQRMAMVLSAYNGGLGWVNRDKTLASSKGLDPLRWFDHVETVNAGRAVAAFSENRGYPRRILQRLEPMYLAAGWMPGACS